MAYKVSDVYLSLIRSNRSSLYFYSMVFFQVSKRLQNELMSLMMSGERGISAFPDGDKLFSWVATVEGPQGTVYEGIKTNVLPFPLKTRVDGGICYIRPKLQVADKLP